VRLAYDGEHRLLASERIQTGTDGQPHSELTRYHYDPMSRRVGKQHLRRVSQGEGQKSEWHIQSSLWFGWDGDRMVTMQNERQASTTIYEPNSFVPMLRVDKQLQADDRRAKGETRTYHVHCNHLGTPEALIAQDSLELVWQIELDPWGQTQREYNPNNMLQPIRMQGQQLDAETGLFYNRYRYYDPAGGRYVTQDPIGLKGGVNLYGYVGDDPSINFDPMGLEIVSLGVDAYGLQSAYSDGAKRACLMHAITERRKALHELEAKLVKGVPLSDWDKEALGYLNKQVRLDAITAGKIGFDFGAGVYSGVATSGGLSGLKSVLLEQLSSVFGGRSFKPPKRSDLAPGRGCWTVAMTNECED
jgi:RHS repeat-associated protein